jgi:CheY-like chemotaxis protein
MLTTVATIIDSYGREVPIYFTVTMDICNEIITDNEWVWQMLLNYLTNACKHTDKGSIHVNVSLCWELPAGRKRSIDISHRRKANVSRVGSPNSSFKNVFDAMRQTEPEPEPEQPPRQQLLFEIVDTGVGVEKARQDALFEVFSQAQSGQSMGTGLGLFSVYSRCDRLGGGCGLVSPNVGSDEGSTFWFTVPYVPMSKKRVKTSDFQRYQTPYILPLKEANPKGSVVVMGIDVSSWKKDMCDVNVRISQLKLPIDSSNESLLERQGSWPDSLVSSATKLMPSAFPFTAFVVDDSQSIRKLLKRTLLGMGFTRVDMFENGKRALDAMKVEMVDVVFMDIQMPIMSGPEAISRLREFEKAEQRERQCVIAVSANIENNIVGSEGFDMQHSKPIREKDIALCMHKYMLSKGIVLEESESRRLDDDRLDTSSAFNNIIISSDSNAKV